MNEQIVEVVATALSETWGTTVWKERAGYILEELEAYGYLVVHRPELPDDAPMLGLATTRELLDEIYARIEISGELDYRTVDGRHSHGDLGPVAKGNGQ